MCEDATCCGCCGGEPELHTDAFNDIEMVGWPGDGSGTDDFEDFNQNEADDYLNE